MIKAHEFWKWAFSDFISNTLRGVLAEYIVADGVGCVDRLRVEWDAYDLLTPDGTKIEVKSSAYLQSWQQEKHSAIRFDISQKKGWDAESNISLKEAARSADVYVFCLFAAVDETTANPLDESQWTFLVCSSDLLNQEFGQQKTVGLASLEGKGLRQIPFDQLNSEIESCKS
jgi:hypothetical protein